MAVLEQRGLTTSRDRTGGISLVKKWIVDTLEETLTVGDRTMLGMPEDSRTSHQLEGGKGRHVVLITYKGVEVETSPDNERWSGELKFREDPIETHPFLDELLARYEGTIEEGRVVWPQFLSGSGKASGGGLSGTAKTKQAVNPMFGAKTWPILIGQVSRTYVRKSFPPDLLDKPGTVLERLPGNSGIQTPDGYVWLTQLPKFDQQGPEGWTLGENYDLVPRDGYLAILYGLIKRR